MKLPRGAFRYSVDRALWIRSHGADVVIEDLWRVAMMDRADADEWLPPSGNEQDGVTVRCSPQEARKLVRRIVAAAEAAAAWKRGAKILRGRS